MANPLRGAVTARHRSPGSRATAYFGPDRGSTASGVHAMIVEVDPETAMVTIKRYVVVHDCGTMINPLLVEGQIHGGVAHGIGNAFYEQLVYDEQGQLMNASLMDYLLPTATDVPPIETDHRETPSPVQPDRPQGRGRGRVHPDRRGVRAGGRGRARRLRDSRSCEIPLSPDMLFALMTEVRAPMTLEGTFTSAVRRRGLGAAPGPGGAREGAARHRAARRRRARTSYQGVMKGQRRPGDGGRSST